MKFEAYTSDTTMSKFLNIQSVEANILGEILPKDIAKMVETYVYHVYNIYGDDIIYANGVYKIKDFSFDEKEFTDNKYNLVEGEDDGEYNMKDYKFYLGEVSTLDFDQAVYVFSRAIAKYIVDLCINGYTQSWELDRYGEEEFDTEFLLYELFRNFTVNDNNSISYDNTDDPSDEVYRMYFTALELSKYRTYFTALYDKVKPQWK